MKMAFVGVFCASLQHGGRQHEGPLYAKRKSDPSTHGTSNNKREITYRFPPYTYTQNPEDFAHLKDPNKIAAAMWRDYVENSGQMDPKLNRPLRHYPAHHYRREMKQKIGLQRKEGKIQKILQRATIPNRRDDFTSLHPIHQPRILDAFERIEAWENISRARQGLLDDAESSSETESEFTGMQQELYEHLDVKSSDSDDTKVEPMPDSTKDNIIAPFVNLEDFSLKSPVQDNLVDDDIGIPDYGGIDMDEDEYCGENYDEDIYTGYEEANDELDGIGEEEDNM